MLSADPWPLFAITPTLMDESGNIDIGAISECALMLRDDGVSDLLLMGAYGEFHSLTDDERVSVVDGLRAAGWTGAIMAGAVQFDAARSVDLANRLIQAGADTAMVAPPIACEVSEAEVASHFEYLGVRVDGDLVVYNNPIFGHDLSPVLLQRLAELPAYVALKQGTTSLPAFLTSLMTVGNGGGTHMTILAASDLNCLGPLASGAGGLTSTNIWVYPQAMLRLARTARSGHLESARAIRSALEPYAEAARTLGQPRTVKAAMRLRGYPSRSWVRSPYRPLDSVEQEQLAQSIRATDELLASIPDVAEDSYA